MASLTNCYAPNDDPNVSFEPLPAGKHLCIITNSEMKPTKNGAGEYLQLELEVVEGPHKGRKLWDRLTLKHPNELTVRIARGTLAQIRQATGVMSPRDSVELHNLPLVASVGLKRREDTGEMTNVVKGYAKRGASGASNAPQAASATNGSVPPWKR